MLRASCLSRRLAPLQEVGVPGLRLFVSRTGVNYKLKKRAEPFAIDEKGKPGRLSAAVAHIESQFGRINSRFFIQRTITPNGIYAGKGSVMKLGSRTAVQGIDVVSTGSLGLDIALGTGGLPKVYMSL